MTVYQYIAQNNPDMAYEVCKRYHYYDIRSLDELAACLQKIVADSQEAGLADVMSLHPDKDTLLELFSKKKDDIVEVVVKEKEDCSCSANKNFLNADASNQSTSSSLTNNTNLYILGGAILVAFAIMASMGRKN